VPSHRVAPTKFAILSLRSQRRVDSIISPRALSGSAGDDGLRVVGINPGAIATDRLITMMRTRAKDRLGDENRWEELMRPLPMGRAGKPEEIGVMVALLASDLSAYTSGTIITIDGGAANRGPMF
jgi:3-oxoacyl-[acyl-carrier protein] reductase